MSSSRRSVVPVFDLTQAGWGVWAARYGRSPTWRRCTSTTTTWAASRRTSPSCPTWSTWTCRPISSAACPPNWATWSLSGEWEISEVGPVQESPEDFRDMTDISENKGSFITAQPVWNPQCPIIVSPLRDILETQNKLFKYGEKKLRTILLCHRALESGCIICFGLEDMDKIIAVGICVVKKFGKFNSHWRRNHVKPILS